MIQPTLIIQGGAGRSHPDPRHAAKIQKKVARILKRAYQRLLERDAVEAVTYAVKLLEDDPAFNAGTGSQLQADGRARLSASLMDGSTGCFAGVINLERIKNPILVAQALLHETDRVLAGEGAFAFARGLGMKPADSRTRQAIRRWKKWRDETGYDTVGALALDHYGNLASATSTGGRGFERPGRVSDSALPVANYADRECAVSATGIGEEIMEEGLAIKIVTRVRDGLRLQQAFRRTFKEVREAAKKMGAVGLDRKGNVFWAKTTETLIFAWRRGRREGFWTRP